MIIYQNDRKDFASQITQEQLHSIVQSHIAKIKKNSSAKKIIKLFWKMYQLSKEIIGVSYMNHKTMAKHVGVCVRTIQRYINKMVELGCIIKMPTLRSGKMGQTSNTYIILPVLESFVEKVCHGGCPPMISSLSVSLKQEKNNNTFAVKEYSEENSQKELKDTLMQFLEYKVDDMLKSPHQKEIEAFSSYAQKIIDKEVQKAQIQKAMKESKARLKKVAKDKEPLPFYNWLEVDGSKIVAKPYICNEKPWYEEEEPSNANASNLSWDELKDYDWLDK